MDQNVTLMRMTTARAPRPPNQIPEAAWLPTDSTRVFVSTNPRETLLRQADQGQNFRPLPAGFD